MSHRPPTCYNTRMTLPPSALPFGHDYAHALRKVRGQRRNLGILIILALLTQIVLWLLAKYDVIGVGGVGGTEGLVSPAAYDAAGLGVNGRILHFVYGLTTFIAVICSVMLLVVLVVQTFLLLQDRRTGVAKTVSAFGFALLLAALVLPWQAFFHDAVYRVGEFAVPGATLFFSEVAAYGLDEPQDVLGHVLHWGRFLVYPLFCIGLAAVALAKSGKPTKVAAEEAAREDPDDDAVRAHPAVREPSVVDPNARYGEETVIGSAGGDDTYAYQTDEPRDRDV